MRPLYSNIPCDQSIKQRRNCYVGECPGPAFSSPSEELLYDSVATYVRWGLQTCPPHARTITTGNANG